MHGKTGGLSGLYSLEIEPVGFRDHDALRVEGIRSSVHCS